MSIFGVSSYFLWTQKGQTVLPLVRGSGFLIRFEQLNTFYRHHVISAAHVTCPVKYRQIYGDTIGLKAIGERHISTRLLIPDTTTHRVSQSFDLEFRQQIMPNTDVVSLRLAKEKQFQELMQLPQGQCTSPASPLKVIDPDLDHIEEGDELILCGVHTEEERANPNDDGLKLTPMRLAATCKAALLSLDYGTVLLASIDGPAESATEGVGCSTASTGLSVTVPPLPLSMCGGPVLRRSSGKCVGVIVAQVMKSVPPRDPRSASLYEDPFLDISEHIALHAHWPLDIAFVPIGEFYNALRRSEL